LSLIGEHTSGPTVVAVPIAEVIAEDIWHLPSCVTGLVGSTVPGLVGVDGAESTQMNIVVGHLDGSVDL